MNEMIEDLEINFIEQQDTSRMGSEWHSYLQLRISKLLFKYYGEQYVDFAELSLVLENPYIQLNEKESFIVKPDISIFSSENKPKRKSDHLKIEKMPLCAIEILSPTQTLSELIDKTKCYLKNGIQSCWIVIPEAELVLIFYDSIENQHTFTFNDTLKDKILNIELSVAELFK